MNGSRYVFRRRIFRIGASLLDGALALRPRRPPPPVEIRRIVLVRLDHVGDLLETLPAIAAVRKGYPGAHVTLVAAPVTADFMEGHPDVDAVAPLSVPWFDRPGLAGFLAGRGSYRQLVRILREGEFDLGVDFRGDVRHLAAMKRAGIPRRLGYGATGGGGWLTHMPDYPFAMHARARFLHLLKEGLGIEVDPWGGRPPPLRPEEEVEVEGLVGTGPGSRPPAVIQPIARTSAKQWMTDRYAELGRRLATEGYSILWTGIPSERERLEGLAGEAGTGRVATTRTLRLLQGTIARAALFVGNDSGPVHLSALAGVPTVVVYAGTGRPHEWRPLGGHVRIVYRGAPCAPCARTVCDVAGHPCLSEITVDAVLDAARTVAARDPRAGKVLG